MKGIIIDYKNNEGIISGENGKRYNFKIEEVKDLNNKQLLKAEVDFSLEEEKPTSIYILKENKVFPTKTIFSILLIISGLITTIYGLYLLNDIAFLNEENKKILNMALIFNGSSFNEVIIFRGIITGVGIIIASIGFILKIK